MRRPTMRRTSPTARPTRMRLPSSMRRRWPTCRPRRRTRRTRCSSTSSSGPTRAKSSRSASLRGLRSRRRRQGAGDRRLSALAPALPGIADPRALQRSLARAERVRKLRAFALTLPLLVFLMLTFLVPIAALLKRAIENPEVANTLPRTASALERWNRRDAPPDEAYAAVLADLGALPDSADAGALARRLNSEVPGARSLVMNAYKALPLERT